MDEILIEDIKVFAHHGVFDFEKENGQDFYVSIRMGIESLTKTDDLNETVDYGKVSCMIAELVQNTTFNLIESVASAIADMVLSQFDLVREVEVTIKKPDAPIPLEFGNVMVTTRAKKHIAYLALGSNMGDREQYLNMAVDLFRERCKVLKVSTFINTAPYGVLDQDDFLNGAIKVETTMSPHELLDLCHEAEANANRVRVRHWGERTLDVDILLYDDEIINDDDLIIPHIEMHMRDFVLIPLVEIGAGAVHPVLRKTAYQLLKELKA